MDETRQSPEQILKQIEKEVQTLNRRHLKIFFGYAAGVGNTVLYSYTTTGTDDSEKINASSVKYNGSTSLSSSYSYDDNGNVLTKSYGENTSITNTYDSKDRITSTTYAGKTTNYTYDSNGQLLSANDDTYAYDNRGNITSKTVNGTTTAFTYSNSGWKDQLVSVNGIDLTYDANGNVLTYGDKEYTWNSGRNLESIVDGDNEYSYTYDENGIRTSKTVNGKTTYYNTKDGVIISQTDGENTWYFQYDTNGTPLGFVLNGTQYFYITNQMGDVLAITDTDGSIVGNYEYDAWGKVLTADTDLAKQNPIRYRGYYYDNETGYYYLQSRYYDSNICRFINSDIAEISHMAKEFSVGTNLFAYCNNTPVNNSDPNGKISYKLLQGIFGGVLGAITQYLSDLISVKFFRGSWSRVSTYLIAIVSGIWDAVTNKGFFKSLVIAVGKNIINQIINKIVKKVEFSVLSIFITIVDFSISYVIGKLLKVKSPSKIRDIKAKARSLGIKGTKKLTAYLNKQIFKVRLANITISNIRSLIKSASKTTLSYYFGNKARQL